ncbi:hypothetical protein AMTRI_Chr06g170640 [Amborella trichopoda]
MAIVVRERPSQKADLLSMASPLLILSLLLLFSLNTAQEMKAKPEFECHTALFSFGDSLTDTGNLKYVEHDQFIGIWSLPYGETFFHRPTGRCSDGRLIVDFFAQGLGLPMLQPYLSGFHGAVEFKKGANFAVAGATALTPSLLREKGVEKLSTNISLENQLQWFYQLLPSICHPNNECEEYMKKSMFLVGEIGTNDYYYALNQGKTIDEVKAFVPHIVTTIMKTVEGLIQKGARTLVVPGTFPMGCWTCLLTIFPSDNSSDYDPQSGCLIPLNNFASFHNSKLQDGIQAMRKKFPQANIIYANYYNAFLRFFESPELYGFPKDTVHSACCGVGGPYNYDPTRTCGQPEVHSCENPSMRVIWDGLHPTEAASKHVFRALSSGEFLHPNIQFSRQPCA